MRRTYEREGGGGEFLGFVLVAIVSAVAFLYFGSARPPSLARVVSMQNVAPDSALTVSSTRSASTRSASQAAVPTPTPRPD